MELVARFGGDEFVVILPETDAEKADFVVRRIREAEKETLTPLTGISLSIGRATYHKELTAKALQELADQAMYLDKSRKAGRRIDDPSRLDQDA